MGAGAYGRASLNVYDAAVLGFSNQLAWRCSTVRTLALYRDSLSANHLDVGVGTGYFLDRTEFPSPSPRLGLLDLSARSLAHAARRLSRYSPEIYRADVLRPIQLEIEPFDSIGLTYLLHCLPGPMESKAAAFDNLKPLLRPGGVIFGTTLLRRMPHVPPQAVALMTLYNALGIFDNGQDSLEGLEAALASRFVHVEVETCGAVALFRAHAPG